MLFFNTLACLKEALERLRVAFEAFRAKLERSQEKSTARGTAQSNANALGEAIRRAFTTRQPAVDFSPSVARCLI